MPFVHIVEKWGKMLLSQSIKNDANKHLLLVVKMPGTAHLHDFP